METDKMITETIGQVLKDLANKYPNDIAIKYNSGKYTRTWSEFDKETDSIAKGMLALGIKKGDHIAIWATNEPCWLQTLFATVKVGGVLVTVNTSYKTFELEYLLRQSDTKLLVMIPNFKTSSYTEVIDELLPELKDSTDNKVHSSRLPVLEYVALSGGSTPNGYLSFENLIKLGDSVPDMELKTVMDSISCHDVTNMQYTSGTTGFPKGVMLTHYNILNNGKGIGDCMNFTHDDKLLIVVPFFHCFGLVLAIMSCITHATSMVPVPIFNAYDVMKALDEEGCTAVHGVPTMYISMLDHPDFDKFKFKLRTGIMAGSPCPIKVMQEVINRMGMKEITITYGLTEASPACTMTTTMDSIERRVHTVGKHMPNVETKIVDPETGKTQPNNVPGEFCARGYNIMKGYYKMPEATAHVIDEDGWLHSGDICIEDDDGYYKVVGRIKDMIIRGGENIYPKEIEEFLYTHEAVLDVQVIGVPSRKFGEEVMACIILKEGYEKTTVDEIQEFCRQKIARHKVPKYVRFVKSFPMTNSGKIQKFKMREEAIEALKLQDEADIETA